MLRTTQYLWFSIEGTDGVGKSSVLHAIKKLLQERDNEFEIIFLDEFSQSSVGDLIRQIINTNRFFMLGSMHHPLAETLTLCADYLYQFENVLQAQQNQRVLLISDRGPYSFLTYQRARIERAYPHMTTPRVENWIRSLFIPIGFPHGNVLLISPINQIRKRLTRREGEPTEEELKFIEQVQSMYIEIFKKEEQESKNNMLIINNLDGHINSVVNKLMFFLHEALKCAGWMN